MGRRLVRSLHQSCEERFDIINAPWLNFCEWFPPLTLSEDTDIWWAGDSTYSLIFGISALPRGQILDVVFKRFILTYTSFLWVTSKSYVNHGIFRGKVFLDELAAHLHLKKQLLHRIMLMRGWSRIIKAIPYIVGSLAVGYFEVSVFSMKWSNSTLWIPILDELCKDVYKVLPRFPSFYCMVFEVR